jgi:serine/threonine protein kinase
MRCNEARLRILLNADEDSREFKAISGHVESCPKCQKRLAEIAADPNLITQVRETLRNLDATERWQNVSDSSVIVSVEHGECDDQGAECEPLSLDFLAPASHPEMLGRIGRYEIERIIGTGGMGIVLKGFDTELHRVVAIKVLKPHLAHNGAARRRFAREAQSAAAVVHEHVIPIYDVYTEGDTPYLVMQYVPGQSLQARVEERGPLDAREVLRIGRQIAAGLSAAHAQGVVHRDVKPANILLEQSVERVLISDFGLARTVDDATLTRTGVVAGTPHYMSPEQATGQPIDFRSDLFSLGSVIYYMCTGRPPFRAEHAMAILNRICHGKHRPLEQVNPDVPPELAEIVDCLLAKNANERFRDAKEVERVLENLLMQLQNGQRSHRLRWRRMWLQWRSTLARTAMVGGVIVVCVFVGMTLSPWRRSDDAGASQTKFISSSSQQPDHFVDGDLSQSESSTVARSIRRFQTPIPPDIAELIANDSFDRDSSGLRSRIETVLSDSLQVPEDDQSSTDEWEVELETLKGQLEVLESEAP